MENLTTTRGKHTWCNFRMRKIRKNDRRAKNVFLGPAQPHMPSCQVHHDLLEDKPITCVDQAIVETASRFVDPQSNKTLQRGNIARLDLQNLHRTTCRKEHNQQKKRSDTTISITTTTTSLSFPPKRCPLSSQKGTAIRGSTNPLKHFAQITQVECVVRARRCRQKFLANLLEEFH